MKNRQGFTLIEMLVVIAVIGIISTVALTALGPSRNRAKDTRIISNMQQIRTLAETIYDGDYGAVPTGAPLGQNPGGLFEVNRADIEAQTGTNTLTVTAGVNGVSYAAFSRLVSDLNRFYCVDSDGFAGEVSPAPVNAGSCQ